MENINVCRLCVGYESLILIGDKYSNIVRKQSYSNIPDKIMYCLDIKVLTKEKICLDCINWLNKYCTFKATALSADKFLKEHANEFDGFDDAKHISSLFHFAKPSCIDAEILNYKKKKPNDTIVDDTPVILIDDEDTSEDDSIEMPPFSHLCPENENITAINQSEEQPCAINNTATNSIETNENPEETRNCYHCKKLLLNEIFWKNNASYCTVCKDFIKNQPYITKPTYSKKGNRKLKRSNHKKCFNLSSSVSLIKVDDPKSIKFDLRKLKGVFKQDVLQSRKYINNMNKKIKKTSNRKCVTSLKEWDEFERHVTFRSNKEGNNISEQPETTLPETSCKISSPTPQPEIEILQMNHYSNEKESISEPDPKIGQQSSKIYSKAEGNITLTVASNKSKQKLNTEILNDKDSGLVENVTNLQENDDIQNETCLKLVENEQSFSKLNYSSDISSPHIRNESNSSTITIEMENNTDKSLGNESEEITEILNIEREVESANNDPGDNILECNEISNTKTQSDLILDGNFCVGKQGKDGEYAMQTDTNFTNVDRFLDMPPLVPIVENNKLTKRKCNLLNISQSNLEDDSSPSLIVRFPKYDAVFKRQVNWNGNTPPVVDPISTISHPISNQLFPQEHAVLDFNVDVFGMDPFQKQINDGNIKRQVISTGGNFYKSTSLPLDNTASLSRTWISSDISANNSESSSAYHNVLLANNEPVANAISNEKQGVSENSLKNNGAVNVKYLEGVQVMPVVYRDKNVNTTVYIVKPGEIHKPAGRIVNLKRSAESSTSVAVRRMSTNPATYHEINDVSSDNMIIARKFIKY